MKRIIAAALLSYIAATPAFADNSGKFYIGANLGSASFTDANITINGTPATFPNPGALGLLAGYHFNPNLAVELGYTTFGKSTIKTTSGDVILKVSSLNFAAVGTLPMSAEIDLFGKLGISGNSYTEETTGSLFFSSGATSLTGSQSSVLFGIGAQYHANSQISFRVQYENFGKIASGSNAPSVSAFSLGVNYDF